MKFNYKIIGVGWAICELQIANESFTFRASYLSDALGDLLNALLTMNSNMNTEVYGDQTSFIWHQEPGLTVWHIKALDIKSNGENLIFRVDQYVDDSEDDPETTLEFACNYDEFVYAVVESLERLIQKFGLVGYQAIWLDADFPVVSYLKLKHYSMHKSEFPFINRENENSLKTMTSMDYEMKLFTTNLKDC